MIILIDILYDKINYIEDLIENKILNKNYNILSESDTINNNLKDKCKKTSNLNLDTVIHKAV